jgi:hypothetical protein
MASPYDDLSSCLVRSGLVKMRYVLNGCYYNKNDDDSQPLYESLIPSNAYLYDQWILHDLKVDLMSNKKMLPKDGV